MLHKFARRCFATVLPLFVAAFISSASAQMQPPPGSYRPVATLAAEVKEGNVRFTVLTPWLIRMEWAADGVFEDRASFAFLNRDLPVPHFQVTRSGTNLEIVTDALSLRYSGHGDKFAAANLSVSLQLDGKRVDWRPGQSSSGNLLGTARTLDHEKGTELDFPMQQGLVSRDGWSLVDDSATPLFTSADFTFPQGEKSPWPWFVRRSPADRQDWYFFGYGHAYKHALQDFRSVSGPVPLPPRWALGSMWTRYWPYTDRDLLDLVHQFDEEHVPLDALVIDMDWHPTQFQLRPRGEKDQSEIGTLGWDGYSWNKSLFPDPEAFLSELHRDGLHVSLNLHPANGVQTWEDAYPAMARSMGIDPATRTYVPFDILNQKFAQNYMNIVHHPLEKQGVDFWWLDWQQQDKFKSPGVDSTFWLNYVHFTDQQREGKRPLLFGRWGGLGNQRYEMGFSGDVHISWESLAFQPYFTATAANVAFPYWNHDIGGHIPGPIDPEMYTRWVQWGAFSPTLRTHTAPSAYADRRIWSYPEPYAGIMRSAFQQRYALMPYIYTEARRTYDTGIAFLRPLYYEWPEADAAYTYRDEYLFGDSMVIAPVVQPVNPKTKLANQKLWVPAGEWVEMASGKHLHGPAEITRDASLSDIPMLTRPGTILPGAPPMLRTGERPVDPLVINVTPMNDGEATRYKLYADGDTGERYQTDEAAWTELSATRKGPHAEIQIAAETGAYPGMPIDRMYEVDLPGDWPPQSVLVNGKPLAYRPLGDGPGWRYDGARLATIIRTDRFSVHVSVTIAIDRDPALVAQRWKLDGLPGIVETLRAAELAMTDNIPVTHAPESLAAAAEFAMRATYHPERIAYEVDALLACGPQVAADVAKAQEHAPDAFNKATARTLGEQQTSAFRQRESEFEDRQQQTTELVRKAVADLANLKQQ